MNMIRNVRNSSQMNTSKKSVKATPSGKFRDLKATKNPKGGTPAGGGGGGKGPTLSNINITKQTDSSSTNLF
jgi:hypothetical protein